MNKLLRFFMLTALLLPFALKAQTMYLTVADGTATNAYVPVYGYYVDDYLRCQTIYPADMLTSMSGENILALTYYLSSPAASSWGAASFVVSIMEVTDNTLTGFLDITNATTVYTGSLDGTQSTMQIDFATPYAYQGGNLLIDVHSTAEGTYQSASFYGVTTTSASWQGYNSTSWSDVTGSVKNFMPKTTFMYGTPPTCFKVSNQTIDEAQTTTNSLTLTWTDALNTSATYDIYDMSDTTLVQAGVTGTSFTVNNLLSNTAYTFGIQTNCGGGDIANGYAIVSGRTACGAISVLPFTEDFESVPTGSYQMPFCWERYVSAHTSAATYPYSYSSSTSAHGGSLSLYIYGTTGSTYSDTMVAIMPELDVTTYPMNGNRVTFWAKMGSASYNRNVYVGVMTNPADITTFTLVDSVQISGTTYTKYSVPMTNVNGAFVAFFVFKGLGTIYMDDVTLEEMPSCLEVTNLTVTATTANSVSLSWVDAANTGATYTIYDMSDNTVVGTATATTYTVNNLTPNTTYTFGVQANCTAGDAPITTVSALTDCSSETLPWSENFDDWTAKSPCWMFMSGLLSQGTPTVSSSAWTLNSSYGSHITLSGKALTMNLYSTNRYWAVTPPIEITNDNVMLSVDVAVAAWSAAEPNYDDNDTLAFLVTTNNGASFTLLQAYDYNQLNALGNTYTTLYIPAAGYNGQTVRFAIYGGSVSGTSPYDNRIAIDNVSVIASSSCMPVTNLTASNVTSDGATLTWEGTATSYTIYDMADNTVLQTVQDTSVVINTLNPNTPYTLGVQANCGSEQSIIANVTFTTLVTCPAPTDLAVTLTPGNGTVASLSWTEVGTAQAWQICLNGDTNNLIDVTTNPYDLTGLTPEQAYTAQVRANCDVNDQSAWSNLVNFTPTNAYLVTVNDGTTTNSYVPIYGLWVDDITKSQFIIPASDLAALQYSNINKLTFYASNSNVSWGSAEFNVYLTETNETTLSALGDYSNMTQVYAGALSISNNIMEVTFTTPYTYMGGNLMIGFLQTVEGTYSSCTWYGVSATGASMGGYGTSIAQRDFLPKTTIAFTPGTQPACLPVTGLTASNVTENGATITWHGAADSYTILDLSDTSVVANVTDTAYNFTNLTPNTHYTIGVVANCGADQSTMVTVSFTTTCSAVAIPFTEGFEANSPTLGCWSLANIDANTGLTTTNPYSGSLAFAFAYNTNPPQYLISPELSGTENGLAVSFMYRIQSTSYPESFQLGYSTTTNDLAAFTWGVEQTNLTNLTYEEYTEVLPAGVKYVSIKYTANDMYYLFIDDVAFMTPPSCLPVSALTVDTATSNSVTISWTGTAASYDVYNGNNFVANVTTNSYTFTGLVPASNYTFGVQAICSATDSADMVTVNAATDCGIIATYPYVQDFSTTPACWVVIDADGDGNNWYLYQGTIQSASYSSTALTPDNWLISPQFAIPATGNYEVTWTATAQDQSWPAEHYGVYVSTTGYSDTANFTMLQEWTLGTGLYNPVIDLSAYSGQNIYIALRHFNCTDQFRLSVDEFIVREQAGANQVTINVGPNNPAYGTVTGGGIYTIGDNVTVTATASTNYNFSKWVDDNNTVLSTNNPYTFVAATDLNMTAIFLDNAGTTYTITVQVNDSTMGTATGGGTYPAGDQVTLVATPYAGYNFVNWTQVSGFGTNVVGTDPSITITVTDDKTFVANFESSSTPTQYTVTLNTADAAMGSVSPAGANTLIAGSNFTATATANDGYQFVAWMDGNTQVSQANPYTFTVNADITLTATFSAIPVEPCAEPTGLAVAANGLHNESVDVIWNNADVDGWNIQWRVADGAWASGHSTVNSYTISGLAMGTTYEIQVQADCGDNNLSDWSGSITATTTEVGIDSWLESNVSLFPNPAREYVDIRVDGDLNVKMMEVYDVYGKLINTVTVTENPTRINVSSLANGMYFVRVSTEAGMVTKTFIKK